MRVKVRIAASDGDVFTAEAAASMIGNRPTFTDRYDGEGSLGKGTVVAAEVTEDGRSFLLTVEVPEPVADLMRAKDWLSPDGLEASLGFVPHKAALRDGMRAWESATAIALSPPMPPPRVMSSPPLATARHAAFQQALANTREALRRDYAPHPGEDCTWDPEPITLGLSSAPMVVCTRCGDVRWQITPTPEEST